jgi:hypothetical protein
MMQLMMDRARLGGVSGAAMVWVRRSSAGSEHRGSFWFRAGQNDEIQDLLLANSPVELVGWVSGEWRHFTTRLVSADPNTGLAVFEGPGEPMAAGERGRDAVG